ncbi:Cys-tRNA(Pro) deacylase [Salinibacterium sp. NG253]|uniref:Cys-tRNA(Pro) deacylase n=1 Tax=Salinibacterium sp. NG253 TaxID=2792039 RepID=UPI0018CEB918|nr:Cys-tRNA(Pro) deacylase [Salinibacterium sp. NG253]MBH0115890.1 Cys-tRNA(Pro) deacylase [Salinibacterium sp. NG253]
MALGTPATVALDALGISFTPHPYAHDAGTSEYGREAATVLGVDPEQVFKTLMTMVDDEMVVAVVPVSGKLDLKALASAVGGKKASMADPAIAQRRTGYVLGGISPLGQRTAHRTVIDETVELFDTVFVSGGTRGFDIELMPRDLIRAAEAITAAIARD